MPLYYNFKEDRALYRDALKAELNTSFPFDAEKVGDDWYRVHDDNRPSPVPFGKKVRHDGYELVDDRCQGKYVLHDMGLEFVRVKMQEDAARQFTSASSSLTTGYTESERETFPQQLAEAKAYLEDIGAAVPFLTAIAEARGMTLTDVANGIIENANEYARRHGRLIGKYSNLRRQIAEAVTVEELRVLNDAIASLY